MITIKRPMLVAALLFGAGICIAKHSGVGLWFGIVWLGLCGFALVWFRQFCVAVCWLAWVGVGALAYTIKVGPWSGADLRSLLGTNIAVVQVEGRVVSVPVTKRRSVQGRDVVRTGVELKTLRACFEDGAWVPARGKVLVWIREGCPTWVKPGSTVRVRGVMTSPPRALAPGLPDSKRMLEARGIHYLLRVRDSADVELVRPPCTWSVTSIADRFRSWAMGTLARGVVPVLPAADSPEEQPNADTAGVNASGRKLVHLVWAMTLGWRAGLTGELTNAYMQSGTMHLFAISGLHVALLAGTLLLLLQLFRIPRAWCAALVIPLLWFYVLVTGMPASAVRAATMLTVLLAGWILKRPADLLNSLGTAALVILVFDPQQLFRLGFQLSFGVVLALGVLVPGANAMVTRLTRADPLKPPGSEPMPMRFLRACLGWFLSALVISTAAWIGSFPLIAREFHLVAPVTLPANIVVVPLANLVLASAIGSLITAPVLPPISELFNWSARLWVMLMDRVSTLFAAVPCGHWYVPGMPGALAAAVYLGLLGLALELHRTRTGRVLLAMTVVGAGLTGVIAGVKSASTTTITVLPLRRGHVVLCEGRAFGGSVLFDCGDATSVQTVVEPFLRARGVNRLAALVLTRGEMNRVGGALILATNFRPYVIITNQARFKSGAYHRLIWELCDARHPLRFEMAGLARGSNFGLWHVLHPEPGLGLTRAIDKPLVLMGVIHGVRVLMLSDLSPQGRDALLDSEVELKADVLIVGAAAGAVSLSRVLLDRVNPNVLVVADPAGGAVASEIRRKISEWQPSTKCRVWFTSETGAIVLRFKKRSLEVIPTLTAGVRSTTSGGPISDPEQEPEVEYSASDL